MKGKKMGQHHPQQDKDYISNVTQADFDAFEAIPDQTHEKYVASIKHHKGVNGKDVQITGDMALAPTRYGFADKAAAQAWIDASERW